MDKSTVRIFKKHQSKAEQFPPLNEVSKPTLCTAAAAFYLNRKPQTLRCWASLETGPIRPKRISGRLAWSVSEIRELLGV